MQIDTKKFPSISKGFAVTVKEGGFPGLVRGWVPTLVGYSIQGAGKFGLYEYFKKCEPDFVNFGSIDIYQSGLFHIAYHPESRNPRFRVKTLLSRPVVVDVIFMLVIADLSLIRPL
jgi:hypothetical protein